MCSLFYNAWKYETERIRLDEGGWQSRIAGTFDAQDAETAKSFPGIEDAVLQPSPQEGKTSLELYFEDYGTVFEDTPQIAAAVGAPPEAVTYHYALLALYLVRSPQDPAPRLLFPMFLLVTAMAAVSLIVIIHNAFAVSMQARIHQFGILSSIGATPKQIRTCLLQEAAALCAVPGWTEPFCTTGSVTSPTRISGIPATCPM